MVAARCRAYYDRQARERMATSTGGATPQLKENLPEAGSQARDAAVANFPHLRLSELPMRQ